MRFFACDLLVFMFKKYVPIQKKAKKTIKKLTYM